MNLVSFLNIQRKVGQFPPSLPLRTAGRQCASARHLAWQPHTALLLLPLRLRKLLRQDIVRFPQQGKLRYIWSAGFLATTTVAAPRRREFKHMNSQPIGIGTKRKLHRWKYCFESFSRNPSLLCILLGSGQNIAFREK